MVNMKSLCENISKQTHGKIPKFSRNIQQNTEANRLCQGLGSLS